MKNYAKFLVLFALISFEISIYGAAENLSLGYLHNKILEETVPELKDFNTKLRALFLIKDRAAKIAATKDLLNFVNETKNKLNHEIETKKMTPAQINAIKNVLNIIERRTSKLQKINLP